MRILPSVLIALVLAAAPLHAQERAERPERPAAPQPPSPGVLRLLPADAVSEKQIDVGGRKLTYTATAGTLPLFDQNGERSAAVFYTAYAVKGEANRPVTFVFNGGPGAASAYLHLGLVGPRIMDFGPDGRDGAAAKLRDNPQTWLEFTDLVMIDPVGTGWSRPAKSDGGNAFWGVRRDAEVIAKVIALYVARNSRGASPKYLLGESYGGFRAAKVARALQREQGIIVNGIVMVSPFIEGAFQWGGDRYALGAALHFPALVATELERKGRFNKEALAEAERFAMTDYLAMLAVPPKGDAAAAFHARIAKMLDLPVDAVARSRGFVRDAYLRHVRATDRKLISSYDGSFAVNDPFPESSSGGGRGIDPVLEGFSRALSGAFVAYARDELGFKTDITYALLASDVIGRWDWHEGSGREPAGASDDLRVVLAFSPSFRLLVSHGYSDLVTPYGVSKYVLDHLAPAAGTSDRTQLLLYRGGHMFYFNDASRRAFTTDAKSFYQKND